MRVKSLWIVFCEEKNRRLKQLENRKATFEDIINEVESGDFIVVRNTSKNHPDQECFLVLIDDYPIVCPFNERGQIIQLITLFPDRKLKR